MMKTLGGFFADTYSAWLQSLSHCCPTSASRDQKPPPSAEKAAVFSTDQPGPVLPPSVEMRWTPGRCAADEQGSRKRPSNKRSRFSGRGHFLSTSSTRPLHISAPSDFRHIDSGSYRFNDAAARPRTAPFRPLELSIRMSTDRLSPLLPAVTFGNERPATAERDDKSVTLTHERNYSSMSFHLPRRPLPGGSPAPSSLGTAPPKVPRRSSARLRPRAHTSPSVEKMVERIANAMIERERLQAEIDSVVERQSIRLSSRPSSAHDAGAHKAYGPGAMPSIPAMPAAAPSFAERLSTEGRPRTAPPGPVPVAQPAQDMTEARSLAQDVAEAPMTPDSPHKQTTDDLDRPLAPPLPLMLRPPLRKKKSFSRVSDWLFPDAKHRRDISLDSVTNCPRPVTGREGFYQCAAAFEAGAPRASSNTVSAVSTWDTEDEGQTVSTTWSPQSTPLTRLDGPEAREQGTECGTAFGHGDGGGCKRQSVGVAF